MGRRQRRFIPIIESRNYKLGSFLLKPVSGSFGSQRFNVIFSGEIIGIFDKYSPSTTARDGEYQYFTIKSLIDRSPVGTITFQLKEECDNWLFKKAVIKNAPSNILTMREVMIEKCT